MDWIKQDIDEVFSQRFPDFLSTEFKGAIEKAKAETVKRTLRPAQRELYKSLFTKLRKPGRDASFKQSNFVRRWMRKAFIKSDARGEVILPKEITPTLQHWAHKGSLRASMNQSGIPMKRRKRVKVEIYRGKKTTLGEKYQKGKDAKTPFAREIKGNIQVMRRLGDGGKMAVMRMFDLREILLRKDIMGRAVSSIERGMRHRFRGILTGKIQLALKKRI
jgi:hypothetical protein